MKRDLGKCTKEELIDERSMIKLKLSWAREDLRVLHSVSTHVYRHTTSTPVILNVVQEQLQGELLNVIEKAKLELHICETLLKNLEDEND